MTDSLVRSSNVRVHDALEATYREFAAPAPFAIEGCPCCISTRGADVLLATPLRELTGQALWRYVSGVFLTIGSERDFRYLLPRILEVSVSDPGNANDPEIVLGKLRLGNWQSWSLTERQAVEEFVDAWFERELMLDLAEADDGWIGESAESVLCGAARAGFPLSLAGSVERPRRGSRTREPEGALPRTAIRVLGGRPCGFQGAVDDLGARAGVGPLSRFPPFSTRILVESAGDTKVCVPLSTRKK